MNSSKLSLADLLTLLTAIGFGFICFLSMNFLNFGDTRNSILVSSIIATFLFFTAFVAKLLKRTTKNFKASFIAEVILLVIFTAGIILFSISPFPHYFAVSENKSEIQNKLSNSISQSEKMFLEYETYAQSRKIFYKSTLNRVVAEKNTNSNQFNDFGFQNGNDVNKQIDNMMFTIHADLFPSNYLDMKTADSTWLADARTSVENWKPIGVVNVITNVDKRTNESLTKLVELSTVRENGEITQDFCFPLEFEDLKTDFTVITPPTILTITLCFLAWALMLFSWFVTKRDGKRLTSVEKYEVVL